MLTCGLTRKPLVQLLHAPTAHSTALKRGHEHVIYHCEACRTAVDRARNLSGVGCCSCRRMRFIGCRSGSVRTGRTRRDAWVKHA